MDAFTIMSVRSTNTSLRAVITALYKSFDLHSKAFTKLINNYHIKDIGSFGGHHHKGEWIHKPRKDRSEGKIVNHVYLIVTTR